MDHPNVHCYAAGVVDSDGCIGIRRRKDGNKYYYQAYIAVGQAGDVCPDMLYLLQSAYQGSLGPNTIPNHGRQQMWRWCVTGKQADTMIRSVYPYLVHKVKQADILIEYRNLVRHPGSRVSAATSAEYLRLYETLKNMHS